MHKLKHWKEIKQFQTLSAGITSNACYIPTQHVEVFSKYVNV